jgi:hypothetical protein
MRQKDDAKEAPMLRAPQTLGTAIKEKNIHQVDVELSR